MRSVSVTENGQSTKLNRSDRSRINNVTHSKIYTVHGSPHAVRAVKSEKTRDTKIRWKIPCTDTVTHGQTTTSSSMDDAGARGTGGQDATEMGRARTRGREPRDVEVGGSATSGPERRTGQAGSMIASPARWTRHAHCSSTQREKSICET